jgi:hypothetical protein
MAITGWRWSKPSSAPPDLETSISRRHTMVDQIYDRDYQASRAALNQGFGDAVKALSRFFTTTGRAIHKFEFDAPWLQRVAPRKTIRRARAH